MSAEQQVEKNGWLTSCLTGPGTCLFLTQSFSTTEFFPKVDVFPWIQKTVTHFRVTIRKVKAWNDFGFLILCVRGVFWGIANADMAAPLQLSVSSSASTTDNKASKQHSRVAFWLLSAALRFPGGEWKVRGAPLCVWGAFQTALWVRGLRTDYLLLRFNCLQLGWGKESLCLENTNCWRPVVLVTHHFIRRNTSPNITKPLTLSWTFRSVLFNTLIPLSWWKSGF